MTGYFLCSNIDFVILCLYYLRFYFVQIKLLTSFVDLFLLEVKSLSCVQLFVTPWTVAYLAPPSMGFSRQGYWSGVPFPSPEYPPNPGIEPGSPALQAEALHLSHKGSSNVMVFQCNKGFVAVHSVMSDSSMTLWTITLEGSSIHGISQAKALEWAAISFSMGSS